MSGNKQINPKCEPFYKATGMISSKKINALAIQGMLGEIVAGTT